MQNITTAPQTHSHGCPFCDGHFPQPLSHFEGHSLGITGNDVYPNFHRSNNSCPVAVCDRGLACSTVRAATVSSARSAACKCRCHTECPLRRPLAMGQNGTRKKLNLREARIPRFIRARSTLEAKTGSQRVTSFLNRRATLNNQSNPEPLTCS